MVLFVSIVIILLQFTKLESAGVINLTAEFTDFLTINFTKPNIDEELIEYRVSIINLINGNCIAVYFIDCLDCNSNISYTKVTRRQSKFCYEKRWKIHSSYPSLNSREISMVVRPSDYILSNISYRFIVDALLANYSWIDVGMLNMNNHRGIDNRSASISQLRFMSNPGEALWSISFVVSDQNRSQSHKQVCWIESTSHQCLVRLIFLKRSETNSTEEAIDICSYRYRVTKRYNNSSNVAHKLHYPVEYDAGHSYTLHCTAINQYGSGELVSVTLPAERICPIKQKKWFGIIAILLLLLPLMLFILLFWRRTTNVPSDVCCSTQGDVPQVNTKSGRCGSAPGNLCSEEATKQSYNGNIPWKYIASIVHCLDNDKK